MEPLLALSVASNIIQVTDFAARIISRSHELYRSADGKTSDHATIEAAADHLTELYGDLRKLKTPDLWDVTIVDKQLMRLKRDSETAIEELREALAKARLSGRYRRWSSVYQALRSVYGDKKITSITKRLDDIRKQVDTALLISLRQRLDRLTQPPSPTASILESSDTQSAAHHSKQLLNAVFENQWTATQADDVRDFAQQLHSHTDADLEARFCDSLLARLYFTQMPDRAESIPKAHAETFEWVFQDAQEGSDRPYEGSLAHWLHEYSNGIYWITGKPGSGKSTLMKFIYNHPKLYGLLKDWAGEAKLTKAGFYFWNSGSVMQMSRLGLSKALLYGCLKGRNQLIISTFKERWEQFIAFGGGREPMSLQELSRAFKCIISNQERRFFFLIDGLDEFEGEPKEIIQFVHEIALPNVKICVASRPWLPFEDAFKTRPSLQLEHLTRQDILRYVTSHFSRNDQYLFLRTTEPAAASSLLQEIVDKASGVFLWVYLVVQSLLEGLSNADRMSDLQARLNVLPSDLESLFDKMLSRLEPEYFKQACEIFRLLRAYQFNGYVTQDRITDDIPTLLSLFYADSEYTQSCLKAPWSRLDMIDARQKAEHMRRRLIARCNGLIEISTRPKPFGFDDKVTYIHRTARDYVESVGYWSKVLQATHHDSFQPEHRWANANLWIHKVRPYATADGPQSFAQHLASQLCCIQSALAIQKKTCKVQKTYLDEVFRTPPERARSFNQAGNRLEIVLGVLPDAPGLTSYLATLFAEASVAEKKDAIASHWADYQGGRTTAVKLNDAEATKVRRIMEYHKKPASLRWIVHRPVVPPLE